MTNFHRFVISCILCWDTLSENTCFFDKKVCNAFTKKNIIVFILYGELNKFQLTQAVILLVCWSNPILVKPYVVKSCLGPILCIGKILRWSNPVLVKSCVGQILCHSQLRSKGAVTCKMMSRSIAVDCILNRVQTKIQFVKGDNKLNVWIRAWEWTIWPICIRSTTTWNSFRGPSKYR